MYRTAASRLRVLKGSNRTLTRFASLSAVATKSSSSGGLFGWLTGERSSSFPPLDFPLKDVALPPPLPDYVEQGKTRITTLKNGVKIASETSANPVASIGLFVDSGSIYETPESFGTTHLLERMAFKSTANRSHLRIVREVEAIGGHAAAVSSREQTCYTYDALKTYVPQMVELLIDSVRNPVFLDWEVNEQLEKVKDEITEASKNPQAVLLEAIHSAGYSGALENPLMALESSLNRLNSTVLEQFVAQTNFALTFEIPGGWLKEKEAMTLTVLQGRRWSDGLHQAIEAKKGLPIQNKTVTLASISYQNFFLQEDCFYDLPYNTGYQIFVLSLRKTKDEIMKCTLSIYVDIYFD